MPAPVMGRRQSDLSECTKACSDNGEGTLGAQDPNPTPAVRFGSHPTWSLHLVVLGMQVVGNKAPRLCPKKYVLLAASSYAGDLG